MTRDEIITTDWARRFKEECPSRFEEAIAIAERAPVVDIVMTDEHSFRGDYKFVIIEHGGDNSFWLDAFNTKEEALSLCEAMGWRANQ